MRSRNRKAELCSAAWFRRGLVLAFSVTLLSFSALSSGQENRKLIKRVDPVYPDLARKMNMTGTVKVEVTITAEGAVSEVKTLGGNPVLAVARQSSLADRSRSHARVALLLESDLQKLCASRRLGLGSFPRRQDRSARRFWRV